MQKWEANFQGKGRQTSEFSPSVSEETELISKGLKFKSTELLQR